MKTVGFVVIGIILMLFIISGSVGAKMAVDTTIPATPIKVEKSTFQNTDQPGPSNLAEYTPANPAWRTGQKAHQFVPASAIHFEARHRK